MITSRRGRQGNKRNSSSDELKILQKTQDMMLYAQGRLIQYPNFVRGSLVQHIQNIMYRMVEIIIEANSESDMDERLLLLYEFNAEIEKLRFFVRFSVDDNLKYISVHQYEVWSKHIDEIGRMLGGWIKSCRNDGVSD